MENPKTQNNNMKETGHRPWEDLETQNNNMKEAVLLLYKDSTRSF